MRFALTVFSGLLMAATVSIAAPKTVLHVPLWVEFSSGPSNSPDYNYVPVAKINPILVQKGQEARVEFVELAADTDFDFMAEQDKLTASLEAAGFDNAQAFGEYYPGNFNNADAVTCYRGDGNGVLEIVLNNTDKHYSDQYTVLGWKFGKKTVYGENDKTTDQETADYLNENSKLWKNYDKKSDSVLILASIGDSGDDVQESLIPRCNN